RTAPGAVRRKEAASDQSLGPSSRKPNAWPRSAREGRVYSNSSGLSKNIRSPSFDMTYAPDSLAARFARLAYRDPGAPLAVSAARRATRGDVMALARALERLL